MDSKKSVALAVVLLVVAVVLLARFAWTTSQANAVTKPPSTADIERQIKDIQDNPHMPEPAKAAAIGQLRAHLGGQAGGAPSAATR